MRMYRAIGRVDDQPTFEVAMDLILAGVEPGGGIAIFSPDEYITEQQRKWWKGVLLPALADDSGDTKSYWESLLKLTVMPDRFEPTVVHVQEREMAFVPSITILSKTQMSELIEGSVAELHQRGFVWVTLPDQELRK